MKNKKIKNNKNKNKNKKIFFLVQYKSKKLLDILCH